MIIFYDHSFCFGAVKEMMQANAAYVIVLTPYATDLSVGRHFFHASVGLEYIPIDDTIIYSSHWYLMRSPICSYPHSQSWSRIGIRDFPVSVSEYSTFGGTCV